RNRKLVTRATTPVLRGQFSMTIQTSWKDSQLDRPAVCAGLRKLADELEMEIKVRFSEAHRRQRMAIFVTKEPRCFEKLLAALKSGKLRDADPALVLSNRRDLEPLAKKARLPFVYIPWDDRLKAEQKALAVLDEHGIDFV